jgi:hypothetical protein
MNSADLLTWFWGDFLQSWVLLRQLRRPIHTASFRRHKWLVQWPFFILIHFDWRSSLITHRLILSFSWVVLRSRDKALFSTVKVRILGSIIMSLLCLGINTWFVHRWWSLVSHFVHATEWTCLLFKVLMEDFWESNYLSLVLLLSFVFSSLRFCLGRFWSHTFFSLETLWFQFASSFFNILFKCVEILLNFSLFVDFDSHL